MAEASPGVKNIFSRLATGDDNIGRVKDAVPQHYAGTSITGLHRQPDTIRPRLPARYHRAPCFDAKTGRGPSIMGNNIPR
jgi:hypothetical protein